MASWSFFKCNITNTSYFLKSSESRNGGRSNCNLHTTDSTLRVRLAANSDSRQINCHDVWSQQSQMYTEKSVYFCCNWNLFCLFCIYSGYQLPSIWAHVSLCIFFYLHICSFVYVYDASLILHIINTCHLSASVCSTANVLFKWTLTWDFRVLFLYMLFKSVLALDSHS